METAAIKIMHAIPGRIRLKEAQIRDNPVLVAQLREHLACVPGVQKIEANPRTSSLILLYDAAALSSSEGFRAFAEPLTALFPELTLPNFEAWQSLSSDGAGAAALPAVGGMIRSFF